MHGSEMILVETVICLHGLVSHVPPSVGVTIELLPNCEFQSLLLFMTLAYC